ncbi:MAG: ATP-binding cassette domain-containing protein [Pseudomonadota bacterium]
MTKIVLDKATVRRRGHTILDGISTTLGETACTIITGPNGAGKTTLLRLLHGMERLRGGTIQWTGERARALRQQAFIFQTPVLLRRSVLDNLIYPLRIGGLGKTEAISQATAYLEQLDLAPLRNHPARQLSGGEKQRLALARAMIAEPRLLLLDEPTSNLDGSNKRHIENMLKTAMAKGTRLIMSTHDMGQAKRLCEEVVFLHQGRVLETTSAARFFTQPATSQAAAYLRGDIVE